MWLYNTLLSVLPVLLLATMKLAAALPLNLMLQWSMVTWLP
jgi:hypothetical protein